jgi:hypothetical protein
MPDTLTDAFGVPALLCAPDGPTLGDDRDAVDLIGDALGQGATLVIVPATRFAAGFFTLSTRTAGAVAQKFVDYRLRLAIVGDLSAHVAASTALRDFVTESNRGDQLWFVTDVAALPPLLERARLRGR